MSKFVWQKIGNAPSERRALYLGYSKTVGIMVVRNKDGKRVCEWDHDDVHPTHWMPLPDSPKGDEQ